MFKKTMVFLVAVSFFMQPFNVSAVEGFNPDFIISDTEMQDHNSWNKTEILNFLKKQGSYLADYITPDINGIMKSAAEIIYESAQQYQVNPKFILVTLQKEQSLITNTSPSQKQLDWATGYAVCDGCWLNDPKVIKHKGFAKQVDGAAGIIRWYYNNKNTSSIIKQKDTPIRIDNIQVKPQSWATAFLYTYTPHLHGNQNFWKIWNTWYSQFYPNGSILKSADTNEIWLIDNGQRRKFKNMSVLVTRVDPQMIINVPETILSNYTVGKEISWPNYSLLKTPYKTYLLDYDTVRPFASEEVVRKLGFNPEEIIEVNQEEINSYKIGNEITADTHNPQGIIYKIAGLSQPYYLVKDDIAKSILNEAIVKNYYKNLTIENHTLKDLQALTLADETINFPDGALIQIKENGKRFVIDKGKKRFIADEDTFNAMGYDVSNVTKIDLAFSNTLPTGDSLFLSAELLKNTPKYLGDDPTPTKDLYKKSTVPVYLVAEYPSGKIISGKNIDAVRPIASLTKLLTAYEALENGFVLEKNYIFDAKKHTAEGNPLKLKNGEKFTGTDIFNALLIKSDNNMARLIATNSGLTEKEFINAMNSRLKDWGTKKTVIADVSGLSDKNKSTARDMLKIFINVLKNNEVKKSLATAEYKVKEVVDKNGIAVHDLKNTNSLLLKKDLAYEILAGKTGYTDEALSVLAQLIKPKNSDKQYVVITLGNKDYAKRFDEPNKIAEWLVKSNLSTAVFKE